MWTKTKKKMFHVLRLHDGYTRAVPQTSVLTRDFVKEGRATVGADRYVSRHPLKAASLTLWNGRVMLHNRQRNPFLVLDVASRTPRYCVPPGATIDATDCVLRVCGGPGGVDTAHATDFFVTLTPRPSSPLDQNLFFAGRSE